MQKDERKLILERISHALHQEKQPEINLTPVPRERMLEEVRTARPDEHIPDDIDASLLFSMWLRA